MIKKKKIIIPISIVLVIALVAGGIFAAVNMSNSGKTVEVISVDMISTYDYGNQTSSTGYITSDVNQKIYLEKSVAVKDVLVQEGDTVTEGMPLMQYDTALMELDIDTKKLEIQTIEMNIKKTESDIQSLRRGVVPSGAMSSNITPSITIEGKTQIMVTSAAETAPQPAPETTPESVPQTAPETVPETTPETVPQTTPETTPESVPQTTPETVPETTPEKTAVEILDKDFDFSKYTPDEKGIITIPCTADTKITPEFLNIIRGKNADGTDILPQPNPEKPDELLPPNIIIRKVRLSVEGLDHALLLDGETYPALYMNSKEECTLQEWMDNKYIIPVEDLAELNAEFFKKYPEALLIPEFSVLCTSETLIAPDFIRIMSGKNNEFENAGTALNAVLHVKDTENGDTLSALKLDGSILEQPFVTSISTSVAEFEANGLVLNQEPVQELGKDTVLDISQNHRDVYEIYCNDDTIITKDFIQRMREQQMTVLLKVEGQAGWVTLDGSMLEEPSEKAIDTPLVDFIANGITLSEESDEETDEDIDIDGGFGSSYTADDIRKMLNDKEAELGKLKTDKAQAELDLKKLEKTLKNATVTSTINGVVTKLEVLDENTSTSEPFMVINSTDGLYLTGNLNEMELGKLTVGQKVSAMSWNTGSFFDATIKEISPYPSTGDDYSYGYNPNSSNYPFIARIDNPPEGLTENEYVEISSNGVMSEDSMQDMTLYIAKAYVRTDERGGSYVFAAGSDGRLEKRTVATGKLLGGYYVEIKDNTLTTEDYIAFPYGKNVKEGVKTKIAEQPDYYY